jgi:enamine deaminase RidA (YjgF/YER057c/UK114 family)
MPKQALNPDGLCPPMGPYSHVTVSEPGRLVWCAGAVSVDADGNIVGEGDIVAQTRQVMENLRIALASAGAAFDDVVKITTWVTDAKLFPQLAPVRAEYLREPYPASALLEVSALMYPEFLVEIEAVAVV